MYIFKFCLINFNNYNVVINKDIYANFIKTSIDFNMGKIHESPRLYLSWAWKQSNLQDFLNQNENKGKLIFKSKSWNKTNKNKHMTHVKQKSNKILLQKRNKNKTKLWKKNILKINVEQTKVMGNSTSIYIYWALSSKKHFKKFSTYMWPMCTHVWIMCQLWIN